MSLSVLKACSLFTLFTLCTCCHWSQNDDILGDSFIIEPCNVPKAEVILRVMPETIVTAYNKVHCSMLCQRDRLCKYAIFNERNKLCEQIYGVTNTLRVTNEEYYKTYIDLPNMSTDINSNSKAFCWVLLRIVTHPWTCIELKDLPSFKNIDDFSEIKLKSVNTYSDDFTQVSQFTVDQSGRFMVATSGKILEVYMSKAVSPTFTTYLRSKIMYIYGNSTFREALDVTLWLDPASSYAEQVNSDPKCFLMFKHVKLESGLIIAETYEDFRLWLTSGLRRQNRHPAYIRYNDQEIVLDINDVIHEQLTSSKPQPPLYFTSRKDFITTREQKSVILKHPIVQNRELPPMDGIYPTRYPLMMDASWDNVYKQGLELIEELKHAILEGKPARIVTNDESHFINADIVAVSLTRDNVMVALTSVIYPLERGAMMQKYTTHTLSFPVLEALNRTLVVCESPSITGFDILEGSVITFSSSPNNWLISTKKWNRLFVINLFKRVIFGSEETLKKSIEMGKNIRVCVKENSEHSYCLNGAHVAIRLETGEAILETHPFVSPLDVFKLGPRNAKCLRQQVLLISSAGRVDMVPFRLDPNYIEPKGLKFEDVSWFAEEE